MRETKRPTFDVDAFLGQPVVARVAAAGPTVRPVWFLWEEGAFWWLTGDWSRLPELLSADPRVALVVDTCDLSTGRTLQVSARGSAEVVAFDADRAHRKLCRYLGPGQARWAATFQDVLSDPGTSFVRLAPERLRAVDLSFEPSP